MNARAFRSAGITILFSVFSLATSAAGPKYDGGAACPGRVTIKNPREDPIIYDTATTVATTGRTVTVRDAHGSHDHDAVENTEVTIRGCNGGKSRWKYRDGMWRQLQVGFTAEGDHESGWSSSGPHQTRLETGPAHLALLPGDQCLAPSDDVYLVWYRAESAAAAEGIPHGHYVSTDGRQFFPLADNDGDAGAEDEVGIAAASGCTGSSTGSILICSGTCPKTTIRCPGGPQTVEGLCSSWTEPNPGGGVKVSCKCLYPACGQSALWTSLDESMSPGVYGVMWPNEFETSEFIRAAVEEGRAVYLSVR